MIIRERRKELGRVFLDMGKYLFTTIAIGSLVSKDIKLSAVIVALIASAIVLIIGFYTVPKDKEE
ncbi:MAG: hypothetical protein COY75_02160 [Nitrospirae bacterium CG_4_10_14_0_8_um_filter_41_23]|nr:hypothetical protein [Nitrospirota bacterium]PIQ95185.1 MAG: hypothetical protein COV68_00555 [Nitrospirae bacterium CG11_big_fil_rev_8_21_14_0_20_41_14]PIV41930.1 MAG: hypothetical protein COS27_08540 [Nitrospirae bacterium CG02_land_8_20_14_3_00_41_53]PIW87245.1 MAG: hypothetical protein COZ94_06175 [Nitrospirae bacterium CG_4_8_14_3_um_filter_41_47]PIY87549.1 MAG: hypothetical protein COY75_02160 [Nitrospirae bacterium CG_4_10_14_0_8_um_filter_41_23]PJA80965.1 MAG: hypothetical protein C